jgi:hypothetical protein
MTRLIPAPTYPMRTEIGDIVDVPEAFENWRAAA